ncbi:MAG TPA: ribosome silencing factor [Kiritimatiellia bacterium]|nr:ribosome silencing factor [Kiritimatiellia bacterium]
MKTTKSSAAKSPAKKSAHRKTARRKTPAKKAPARRKAAPAEPLRARVAQVRAVLESKKGENVVVMRIADVSSVADYMILCTGLNNPHLRALADEVAKQLRLETPPVAAHRRAGSVESEWIVLDYFDFIVHLFTPQMRSYYALEQLWKDAPVVS